MRAPVPDVTGRSLDVARASIEAGRFTVGRVRVPEHTDGRGLVVKQSPGGGSQQNIHTSIALRLGPLPPITVPAVIGLSLDGAKELLARVGLSSGSVDNVLSDENPGIVLTQHPDAGTTVPPGSTVALGDAKPRPDTD